MIKKPRNLVIKELKELFDIDNNTHKGSYVFEGDFRISKTHFSRKDVLDMLNNYFNGVSVDNGYVKVDPITLVHTTFEVIDVNEIEVNSPESLNKKEPKQETLEEFIKKQLSLGKYQDQESAIRHSISVGAKWQQEQILDFLYEEITERRDYSASKMCEKVIEFIEQFKNK